MRVTMLKLMKFLPPSPQKVQRHSNFVHCFVPIKEIVEKYVIFVDSFYTPRSTEIDSLIHIRKSENREKRKAQ